MTDKVGFTGRPGRCTLSAAIGVATLICVLDLAPVRAQSHAGTPKSPTFEVASIKPNKGDSTNISSAATGDRFTSTNVTPLMLIAKAYRVKTERISGGPGWVASERYDVEAKGAGANRPDQLGLILQSLLADRFGLVVHRAIKEVPVYALVVGRSGAKLHEVEAATTEGGSGVRASITGHLAGKKASMSDLAGTLTSLLGQPVMDQTGIKGAFDFELHWTPDESQPRLPEGAPPPETSGPSIFTAVQEQLGLRLQSSKGPTEVIIIDSIMKPSEN
jgi:uncharacterized protein (TIGR03435 family)